MKQQVTRIMVLASIALLLGVVSARAVTTVITEALGTLDANPGGPRITLPTQEEGGDETSRSGLMLRINPTTVIILSPGDDQSFETSDDGVWHCFKLGTAGQGCEFLETGALLHRRSIRVNTTTAVVLGGGGVFDAAGDPFVECESVEEGDGTPDDILHVLRRLGAAGATVESVDGADLTAGGLCFGAIGSDPIRINNATVLFNQPGADVNYVDDSACPTTQDADDSVVVAKIGRAATVLRELEVGADLGIYLTGAPASFPVRVSDSIAVIASPGEDSQFADGSDGCTDADDGLVVVRGLGGSTPVATFRTLGSLAANPSNRPVMINTGTVVVLGTGESQKQQEEELEDNSCCVLEADNDSDDEIHVVKNLGGAPAVTTFSGFGYMRGLKRLNETTAVAFEEDHSLAMDEDSGFREDLVILNVNRIRGIGGTPSLTSIQMPNGDAFHRDAHFDDNVGVPMNPSQILFAVTGPPQVYLLTDGAAPFLASAGWSADDGAEVKITRLSETHAAYTRAKQGGVGAFRILPGGRLESALVSLAGEGDDGSGISGADYGINQPSSQPVAIGPWRFVVASGGSNNTFADDTNDSLNGHDDGFLSVTTSLWPPRFKFVTVRNSCGSPGCKPLALGSDRAPIVAILGVGDNGQFDNDGDEADSDDELNVVKGF